jgi:glyoxylase-like metal-dependent hydrolase (beta-lactamase superfamily II)
VLPTITPHIAGVTASADPLAAFFASLQRMHDFEVTTVLPAHGHPFHDLAGRADDIARHHDERLDILRKVGRTELPLGTVPEFMRYLFKERAWGDMAESETFAHLEHLRMLGEASVTEVDGLMAYAISD